MQTLSRCTPDLSGSNLYTDSELVCGGPVFESDVRDNIRSSPHGIKVEGKIFQPDEISLSRLPTTKHVGQRHLLIEGEAERFIYDGNKAAIDSV